MADDDTTTVKRNKGKHLQSNVDKLIFTLHSTWPVDAGHTKKKRFFINKSWSLCENNRFFVLFTLLS